MATVSTPQKAYIPTVLSGTAMGRSSMLTVAVSIPGWEGYIPFVGAQPNTTSLSAGWEFYAYRSTDGGATYETQPSNQMTIVRNPNTRDQKTMTLGSGMWMLLIKSGGNTAVTFSFSIGTVEVISAIING